jgi:hypothetical protein
MATENEKKEYKKSLDHRRNFGLITALTAAGLVAANLAIPALMLPGVLISGYYQGKIELNEHGKSWRKKLSQTIFRSKSHDAHHGHGHGGH